jgi:hypothetical protein
MIAHPERLSATLRLCGRGPAQNQMEEPST